LIRVKNLCKRLGNFELRDINLRVNSGEHLVILGPIGSGKTTLLKCIAGIFVPDSGTVEIDGRDVTKLPPEKRNLSYVPQDYKLFPHLNVAEDVAFGLRVRGDSNVEGRVREMLELVGLTELSSGHVERLSEGQKQLVAIARALAIRPSVLLLDEPFARLDSVVKARLRKKLARIHEETETTIIHVTHDFEAALGLRSRVAVMDGGRLLQESSEVTGYLQERLGYIPVDLERG
jgi:ABC-type Fe3+/spermidine/putrescine transport system ATPase subunit